MNRFFFSIILYFAFYNFAFSQEVELKPYERIIQSYSVYFETGLADIDMLYDTVFAQVAEQADKIRKASIYITAHTDSIGNYTSNEALAKRRANAVTNSLSEVGIDAEKLQIKTYGERKPIATNSDENGRQLNRRATIEIVVEIPAQILAGQVVDKENGEGIKANVYVTSELGKDSVETEKDGSFQIRVPRGPSVSVEAYSEGTFFFTERFKANDLQKPLKVPLQKATEGSAFDLQSLYFVGGQAVLLEKSLPTLPKVLKFARLNPTLRIEIAGHINYPNSPPVSKNTWNYDLSVRRAKLVHDYLIRNGIDASRISYEGYGNWEMKYPKATSKIQQSFNRRVEVRIMK